MTELKMKPTNIYKPRLGVVSFFNTPKQISLICLWSPRCQPLTVSTSICLRRLGTGQGKRLLHLCVPPALRAWSLGMGWRVSVVYEVMGFWWAQQSVTT
jgi:hypothetical protein